MNNNSSTSVGRSASYTKDASYRACHQKQEYVFVNQQAAAMNAGKSNNTVKSANAGAKSSGNSGPYPTPRLTSLQPGAASASELASNGFKNAPAEKTKYHEAISRTTQNRFDEELSKAFQAPLAGKPHHVASPIQQHPAQPHFRKPSLAATHPTQYESTSMPNNPPAHPHFRKSAPSDSLSPMRGQRSPTPKATYPPVYPPYTDPMHQKSTTIPEWSMNRTVLKADVNIENGNVISPTWMIGLPMGSMIEVANTYPAAEDDTA